jgi:hypothetical protein
MADIEALANALYEATPTDYREGYLFVDREEPTHNWFRNQAQAALRFLGCVRKRADGTEEVYALAEGAVAKAREALEESAKTIERCYMALAHLANRQEVGMTKLMGVVRVANRQAIDAISALRCEGGKA